MMGGFGFGGMLLGGLLMLAFWVLVIGGAIWLVVTLARGSQSTPGTHTAGQTPLDILKARYAKGEVTKEQFEEMKRDLGA
jgi:putative membrane protein